MHADKSSGQFGQEGCDGDTWFLLLLRGRTAMSAAAAAGAAAATLAAASPQLLILHAVLLKEQQQVLPRDLERLRHCQAPVVVVHCRQVRLCIRRQHSKLIEGVPTCAMTAIIEGDNYNWPFYI